MQRGVLRDAVAELVECLVRTLILSKLTNTNTFPKIRTEMLSVSMIIRDEFLDEVGECKKSYEVLGLRGQRPLPHRLRLARVDLAKATTYNESKHINFLNNELAFSII